MLILKMANDTIRICLLGGSGTGKTAFFSGVYQSLISGVVKVGEGEDTGNIMLSVTGIREQSGFFDSREGDDGDSIKSSIINAGTMDTYLIRNRFAPGTSDSTEFTFELRINKEVCCDVVIIDYAGEIVDNPRDEMIADYLEQLCESLAQCDAVIVMADAVQIARNIGNISAMNNKLFAARVNALYDAITDIAARNNRHIATLIALSKSDHNDIPETLRRDNYSEISHILAERIYARTLLNTVSTGGSFGIMPISAVGDGNTDAANHIIADANICQKNIDTAMLFCIYNAAARLIGEKDGRIEQAEKEYRRIRLDFGKKARQERERLSGLISEEKKKRELLMDIVEAISSDPSYFGSRINELRLTGVSEIGEVE